MNPAITFNNNNNITESENYIKDIGSITIHDENM